MSPSNLITGGAGFIGCNLAQRLLQDGERVILLDNLSRPNVSRNAAWLQRTFGDRVELVVADIRDAERVQRAVNEVDYVFHFAARATLTCGWQDPLADFDVNARGTLLLLEALRAARKPPGLFFTSTSKVYGSLPWLALRAGGRGYEPLDEGIRARGVGESAPLDFQGPHACSKGTADQYVRDYARTLGLRSVVFRTSCVYGPRQFGTEDQGWVAHFLLRTLQGAPVTIYGDGAQVRDLLFVSDLVEALLAARAGLEQCSGHVFNLGGGPENSVSVRGLLDQISALLRMPPRWEFGNWRTGDQRYYVSDTNKFARTTGWRVKVPVSAGLFQLAEWLRPLAERSERPLVRAEPIVRAPAPERVAGGPAE